MLPLGTLSPGDPVVVLDRTRSGFEHEVPARVVSVARVWVTIHPVGRERDMRFRLDNQTDGHEPVQHRFVTPAQADYEVRLHAARNTLKLNGFHLAHGTRPDDEALLAVAGLLEARELPKPVAHDDDLANCEEAQGYVLTEWGVLIRWADGSLHVAPYDTEQRARSRFVGDGAVALIQTTLTHERWRIIERKAGA